jgi:hypothetical protein
MVGEDALDKLSNRVLNNAGYRRAWGGLVQDQLSSCGKKVTTRCTRLIDADAEAPSFFGSQHMKVVPIS